MKFLKAVGKVLGAIVLFAVGVAIVAVNLDPTKHEAAATNPAPVEPTVTAAKKVTAADLYVGNVVDTLKDGPGCMSPDVLDRARELAHDDVAFKKYFGQRLITGDCTIFKKGTQVTIEESAVLWSDRYRVRQTGEIDSYWVPSNILMD